MSYRNHRWFVTAASLAFTLSGVASAATGSLQLGPAACPAQAPVNLAQLSGAADPFDPQSTGVTVPSASTGPRDEQAEIAKRAAERAEFERILRERSAVPVPRALDASLAADQRASIEGEPPKSGPVKIGAIVDLNQSVDFSSVDMSGLRTGSVAAGPGHVGSIADGGLVWEAAVHSAGAKAMRIHFAGTALAAGVHLYVYNEIGQVHGPYDDAGPDDTGDFWSPSVLGDSVWIHLRADSAAALAASHIVISQVSPIGSRFHVGDVVRAAYEVGPTLDNTDFCGASVPDCTINGVCAINANPGLMNTADAVAQISFVKPDGTYICSGTLINPTGSVRTPYFLTANHCISTQSVASTLEAHFRFRTAACDGTCTMEPVSTTHGSTLMVTGAVPDKPDFTLLRLNSAPGGLRLLGWSTAHPAEGAYLIHMGHPAGSPLAYSVRRIHYSELGECTGWPRPTLLYSGHASVATDAQGATAGGSSGGSAVLLNSNATDAYIIGQLLGECGVLDSCNANNTSQVDGAFEYSFPYMRVFLYDRIFSDGFQM